ncbi:MAG TPA: PQQ-dependent sugar dehydrogenase [Chloroflexota bacterium]|nr:PQQ-dependent sugar dehydrogenase [Chloroflexota bacterium]
MKRYKPLFLLFILLLAACGAQTPTATPAAPTAAIAAQSATETPAATNTAIPATATAVPATNTPVPEPATATAVPTTDSSAAETETATPLPEATETEPAGVTPAATAASTEATAVPPTADPNVTASATAPPTTVAAPPPAGSVPIPPDNNYPAYDDKVGWEQRIIVPAGFQVSYVGRVNGNPTSITFGPDGLLYIAMQAGSILTMNDSGGTSTYATGFNTPTGIAFRPGTNKLYVSDRVLNENVGGEAQVSIVNQGQLIGGLPCCYTFFHAANGIAFGPDGYGYVGVGGRADHGEILDGSGRMDEMHPLEASILRFHPDTGAVSVYARGFRNPYDIAWDANGQLWATDNTPDYDPPERLHRVVPGGIHGYPYYDCDVCFSPPEGVTVIPPLVTFVPSSSPTGIEVYLANQFPGYYNSMFVALWSSFVGAQKIMHVRAGGSAPVNFATGFAAPIDVTTGPDGSLYVADWATGIIFKISYSG